MRTRTDENVLLMTVLLSTLILLVPATAPASSSSTVTRYQFLYSDIDIGTPVFSSYPTAGGCFTMKVPATNNGNVEANEIVLNLTAEEPFSFDGDSALKTISRLGNDVWGWVEYKLCIEPEAPEGKYTLDISYTYEELGDAIVFGNITLPVGGVPRFELTMDPTTVDLKLETLTLRLKNIGTGVAKDVELVLSTDDTPLVLEGMNVINIQSVEPGQWKSYKFKCQVKELKPFNLPVSVSYKSSLGESKTQTIKVGISARQKISTEGLEIGDVAIEPEFVFPGQHFSVDFKVENVGLYDARQVKVIMGKVATSDIGTEVFVPSGQGNTVHLGTIPPGEANNVTFTMLTSGNANSGSYSVPVTLTFIDFEDNDKEMNQKIGVAVRSKSTLTPTEVTTVPAQITAGSTFTLTIGVSNGGPAKATSLKVRFLNDDSFQAVGKDTVFIGTLDVDLSDSAEFTVLAGPRTSGSVKLPLVFEYVDDYGNIIQEPVDASITVQGLDRESMEQLGNMTGRRSARTMVSPSSNGAAAGITIESPSQNPLMSAEPIQLGGIALVILVLVYLIGKMMEPKRGTNHQGTVMRTFTTLVANRMALAVIVLVLAGYWYYSERTVAEEEFTISQIVTTNAEVKRQLSKVPDVTAWRIIALEKGRLAGEVDANQAQFLTTWVVRLDPETRSDKRVKAEVDTRMRSVTSMDLCTVTNGEEDCKILYEASDDQQRQMRQMMRTMGGAMMGGGGRGFRPPR